MKYQLIFGSIKKRKNRIRSTKYQWWNFIIFALLSQFRMFHYSFFLLVFLAQVLRYASGGLGYLLPYGLISGAYMLRELFEDLRRWKNDRKINSERVVALKWNKGRKKGVYPLLEDNVELGEAIPPHLFKEDFGKKSDAQVVTGGKLQVQQEKIDCVQVLKEKRKKTSSLNVGELVRLEAGNRIPSDCVVVCGECWIETSNLDGETSLKLRKTPKCFLQIQEDTIGLVQGQARIDYDSPQKDTHVFYGRGTFHNVSSELSLEHFLPKGGIVQSCKTGSVIAISIYTGKDTKMHLNLRKTVIKASIVEKVFNVLFWCLLVLHQILAMVLSIWSVFWINNMPDDHFYLGTGTFSASFNDWVKNYLHYFGTFGPLVPFNLYLQFEAIKPIQGYLINSDKHMVHEMKRAQVNSSNLCADLGQIGKIFTDKTGTLTENVMMVKSFQFLGDKQWEEHENNDWKQFLENSSVEELDEHFKCSLICNSVYPKFNDTGVSFEGESSDEISLCHFASSKGYQLLSRSDERVTIKFPDGSTVDYEIEFILPFTSKRSRMTVIVKDNSGDYVGYSKGADSVMLPENNCIDHQSYFSNVATTFANRGLRTMIFSIRKFESNHIENIRTLYQQYKENKNQEVLDQISDIAEDSMTPISCTGINDALQQDAPDTVRMLKDAGIKFWMLTGDKLETAIQVAKKCDIISQQCLMVETPENIPEFLEIAKSLEKGSYSVCINADIASILLEKSNRKQFKRIANQAESVICSRCPPHMKATMVKLGKTHTHRKLSLAIGDGSNDISMLQTAHVGIGIRGVEGDVAGNSSDFALGRFSHLQRLLLVHGRNSFFRQKEFVLYSFYKTVTYLGMIASWEFLNGFSAYPLLSIWNLLFFHLFWTCQAYSLIALIQVDSPAKSLLKYPRMYLNIRVSYLRFIGSLVFSWVNALWQVILVTVWLYEIAENRDFGMYETARMQCFMLSLIIVLKSFLILRKLNKFWYLTFFFSLGTMYLYFVGISLFPNGTVPLDFMHESYMYGIHMLQRVDFHLITIFVVGASFVIDATVVATLLNFLEKIKWNSI